jgi:integrase
VARRKTQYGQGGIYDDPQRPGHKIVVVPLGHGRPIRRRAVDAKTAEKLYADLIARRDADLDIAGGAKTLHQLFIEWRDKVLVPRQETKRALAPKTIADYRDTIARYLLPGWGNYRLEEFNVPLVLEIYHTLRRQHSENVAHRALTKLRMLLQVAIRRRYVDRNAVDDARPEIPPLERTEKPPMTIEETHRLLAVVANLRLATLYYVALILGLRVGEILGLQWGDIDWQHKTITIRRQVQEVEGRKAVRMGTKTSAGSRTLPIPPALYHRLRTQWEAGVQSVFIFPNDEGGALSPSNFARHFHGGRIGHKNKNGQDQRIIGVRQKANLPDHVTPHTWRHAVATRLMELGVSEEIRAAILGHRKKGITQHYSHATLKTMREALERLERLIVVSEAGEDVKGAEV